MGNDAASVQHSEAAGSETAGIEAAAIEAARSEAARIETVGIETVGVVGLGTMGAGIAEVFARAGLRVVALEAGAQALARGRAQLDASTGRAVRRGRLSVQEQQAILARVRFGTDLTDLAGGPAEPAVDLVVEAIPERPELKRELFTTLDKICPAGTILATNTSSLSVTDIAMTTGRPAQVVGMHFFNPAPVLRLVEVVHTVVSDPAAVAAVEGLARRLGKLPVVVRDRAGFVANTLLFGYLNDTLRALEARLATRDDIDTAMRAAGLPMGPLALLDLIGLDTSLQVLETMYAGTGERAHAPSPLLRQLVAAGLLGRKTGRGLYRYDKPNSATVVPDGGDRDTQDAAPVADSAASDDGGRAVRTVGVVGRSAAAALVAAAFEAAGAQVRTVPAASDSTAVGGLADCDLVVEAGSDEPAGKRAAFAALGAACGEGTVLASAGATVPVSVCAAASGRPADVVGLHPVTRDRFALRRDAGEGDDELALVEIVTTVATGGSAAARAQAAASTLGVPVVRCRDRAGFLVGALVLPYLNDAARMVEDGYATPRDIDTAMKAGCGYPRGPFEQIAAIGPDRVLHGLDQLAGGTGDVRLAPSPYLAELALLGLAQA